MQVSLTSVEVIEFDGTKYAEVIRADACVERTCYFSPPESSFQFGLVAHDAGYREDPHFHRATPRTIDDLQQMLVVQRGVVEVELFSAEGRLRHVVTLKAGDAIVLVHGAHALRVTEDFQALTVKQGPYLGVAEEISILAPIRASA